MNNVQTYAAFTLATAVQLPFTKFMVERVYWLLQNIPSQEQGAFHWTM